MSTLSQINEVFRDVFENDTLEVTRETTAADVEDWDSLMHVTLVLQVERTFGVKFTSSEISSLDCVGDLIDLVEGRAGKSQ